MNTCFPVKLHHRTIAPSHRTQPAPLLTLQSTPSPSPPTLLTLQSTPFPSPPTLLTLQRTPFPSPPTLSSPRSALPFPRHLRLASPCAARLSLITTPLPTPRSALPFPRHLRLASPCAAHSLSLTTNPLPTPCSVLRLASATKSASTGTRRRQGGTRWRRSRCWRGACKMWLAITSSRALTTRRENRRLSPPLRWHEHVKSGTPPHPRPWSSPHLLIPTL